MLRTATNELRLGVLMAAAPFSLRVSITHALCSVLFSILALDILCSKG